MKKYDLIVAGGGFAGVASALSAARNGLKVLLVERTNCLGGAAVTSLVNPFMPYWTNVLENGEKKKQYLSAGIFREILNELSKAGALGTNEMCFDEEYLKLILNRMVKKESIDLLFHSYLSDVALEGDTVKSIKITNKSGNLDFIADCFIDATGDGDLAALSGCSFQLGREKDNLCQPMTLCFRLGNVDVDKFHEIRPTINELYGKMYKEGKFRNIRDNVLVFPNMADGVLHFNSTRVIKKNPIDAFDITEAEIETREQAYELYNFLKENIDGFQNSRLIMTASQTGVRESRKIDGEYTLTREDLVSCKVFDDSIALGNYDIDIHNPEGAGTSHYYFEDGTYYTIPYRCLVPKNLKNLLVAGRCVSATHEAQASIRIIPIVCCLGEAAGTAAAVAHKDKTTMIGADIKKIQEILKNQGALIY